MNKVNTYDEKIISLYVGIKYIRNAYAILETQDLDRAKLIHDKKEMKDEENW